ncbi:hypothetical protein BaRGS_00020697 [Batillaria attramentaria]|uniref:Dolichyldiphosphatase n=1 Tax=Batillaria attramentaria TaxID=370345 RepID=A0ABD0KMF6_9CAEN
MDCQRISFTSDAYLKALINTMKIALYHCPLKSREWKGIKIKCLWIPHTYPAIADDIFQLFESVVLVGPMQPMAGVQHQESELAIDLDGGSTCEDASKLKAISFTHVEYYKGDFLGYIFAWSSLLPFCIGVGFVTLIIFRRDLHTMSYFLGIVVNEAANWILKHIIQERRPGRVKGNLYTEYGMPSSHSQFMWFFATYMAFFISIRVYRNYNIIDDLWKGVVCGGSCVAAAFVTYSRVYLEYHTLGQVLWGCFLGIINGALWFAVVQFVLTPFFPLLASSPVGEFLMLRDSTLIPHVMWFEYTSSRSEARSRQRKVTSRKSQ